MIGLVAGHSGDALCDELHKRGYEVAMVCGRNTDPGIENADKLIVTDLSNLNEIVQFFKNYGVEEVIIGTGSQLAFELAHTLEEHGIMTNIDFEHSKLAKNKPDFKDALRRIGVPTPDFMVIDKMDDIDAVYSRFAFPFVVKAINDVLQPRKVNNKDNFINFIKEIFATGNGAMIETYIDGNDCTVAVASDGERVEDLGVTHWTKIIEYKLQGFDNPRAEAMDEETENEIRKIAQKIVSELGFLGLVRLDFMVRENTSGGVSDIFVLELNTVMVTGYAVTYQPLFRAAGYDIAKIHTDVALKLIQRKKQQ